MAIRKVQKPGSLPSTGSVPVPTTTTATAHHAPGSAASSAGVGSRAYTDAELLALIPPHTCCIYGDSGTGKSTLAANYPKTGERPQLVLAFDPPSKAHPYKAGLRIERNLDEFYQSAGIVAEDCYNEAGELVRRVEHYIDPDVDKPRAVANVEARLAGFYNEAASWSSVVFDSMSFFQYGAMRRAKFMFPMPAGKEQGSNLAWYNQVKEDVNRIVRSQAVWWPTTTIFIFHTSEDKAEFASETVRGILAVGKLPGELPSGFSEMYHLSVKRVGDQYIHQAKTKHDGLWAATSIIAHAPSPCEPDFRVIWANYLAEHSSQ